MIITGKLTDYKSILKRQIAFEDKLDNKFRVEMNEFKFVVEKKLAKFDEMFAFWLVAKTEFLTNEIERMVKLSMVDFALTNKFKDDLLAHTTNIVTTKATAELTQIKSDLQNLYDQIGLTIISKTDFDAAIAVINSRIDELPAGGGGGAATSLYINENITISVNDFATLLFTIINSISGVSGHNYTSLLPLIRRVDPDIDEVSYDFEQLVLLSYYNCLFRKELKDLYVTYKIIDKTITLSEPLPFNLYLDNEILLATGATSFLFEENIAYLNWINYKIFLDVSRSMPFLSDHKIVYTTVHLPYNFRAVLVSI